MAGAKDQTAMALGIEGHSKARDFGEQKLRDRRKETALYSAAK